MNDTNPDYVVVGETKNYNYTMLETAVALVRRGVFFRFPIEMRDAGVVLPERSSCVQAPV